MAQNAVKGRECPNKAGAAKKAHSDCMAVYNTRKGVEKFCACFAEVSAAMYMEEELLRLPGAGASLKCQDQGILIPN
jgi:hypothetical protein